jgi:ectoine hydroxylase-related dioxygenase (phytanoyl-CoA dioxygenase family)
MVELFVEAGDVLMFTDTITHGSAQRTNDGYRRMVLYRYSPQWIRSRFNYQPSPELWARLTKEQREIIQPITPRLKPAVPPAAPVPANA